MSLCFLRSVLADPYSVSEKHGRRGDARRFADGRRQSPGLDLVSSLRAAFRAFRNARGLRIARRGHGHTDRRAGKLRTGPGELAVRRLEQRMIESVTARRRSGGALCRQRPSRFSCRSTRQARRSSSMARHERPAKRRGPNRYASSASGSRGISTGVFATVALAGEEPAFESLTGVASGVVATPISSEADELLIWFRKERMRTVHLGGNPFKLPSDGDDRTTFAASFLAQWHQVVEGTSDPWTVAESWRRPTHRRKRHRRRRAISGSAILIGAGPARTCAATGAWREAADHRRRGRRRRAPRSQSAAAGSLLGLPRTSSSISTNCAAISLIRSREGKVARAAETAARPGVAKRMLGGSERRRHVRSPCARIPCSRRATASWLRYPRYRSAERRAAEGARNFRDILSSSQRRDAPHRLQRPRSPLEVMSSIIDNAQLAALEIADDLRPPASPRRSRACGLRSRAPRGGAQQISLVASDRGDDRCRQRLRRKMTTSCVGPR